MTINVYWSRANPGFSELESLGFPSSAYISPLRIEEPVPLTKHLNYKEFFGPSVSRCPAIVDDIKNTFVIKSPVDITIDISKSSFQVTNQDLAFAQAFLGEPQGKFGIHQLSLSYNFFAEKSLLITQLPAYYDSNSYIDNTHTITASFDIGRWYRPAGKPAFILKKDAKQVVIKQGDPLLYVRFNTQEKVKLIEFDDTVFRNLKERSPDWICTTFKRQANSVTPLAKCYELFEMYKMRQRMLKLIKKNLV